MIAEYLMNLALKLKFSVIQLQRPFGLDSGKNRTEFVRCSAVVLKRGIHILLENGSVMMFFFICYLHSFRL